MNWRRAEILQREFRRNQSVTCGELIQLHAQAKVAMNEASTVEPGTTPGEPGAAVPGATPAPGAAATPGTPPATGAASATNVTTTTTAESDQGGIDTGEEPQKPFLLRPIGAITVILLVAFVSVVVMTYKKIRGRANEVLE